MKPTNFSYKSTTRNRRFWLVDGQTLFLCVEQAIAHHRAGRTLSKTYA